MNCLHSPRSILMLLLVASAFATGCRSIGPGTVERDRMHYSAAVAESWKEQLLLNIVKTRYGDAPAFLEVASVVAGYSLETGVSLEGQYTPSGLSGDTFTAGGLGAKYTDRPTISYTPMTGERFARSLLSPVPLDALMFVIQGGVPADFLFGLTAQCIEGHRNQGLHAGRFDPGSADFGKLLQLVEKLKQAGLFDSENVRDGENTKVWLHLHSSEEAEASLAEARRELKRLLGVPENVDRVRVVFGIQAPEPEVVAIRTRSLMQILATLGMGVEIPEELAAKGAVVRVPSAGAEKGFRVRSGKKKPETAFVAVPHEGLWFWIDRDDLVSKTTLSIVTLLSSFLDNSGGQAAPVLTIPTN